MGGKKNTSLDGEACKIVLPLRHQKTSLVLAKWTTSDGAKELCQGCAGLVHQLACGGGAAPARPQRARRAAAASAARGVLVAAGMGHEACVAAWLDAGASVEFGGRKKIERPLHKACGNGHALARVLLDRGADLEARDKHAKTALYRAAEGGKDAVVELLLRRGAGSSARPRPADTPLATRTALKLKRRKSTKEDEAAKAARAAAARARRRAPRRHRVRQRPWRWRSEPAGREAQKANKAAV
ncbi:hypothetical protein JL720_16959 [Aureococcus anophagefferens]|nr:hypothetical protein JL720_16959 [Aureococcus anophagefferens]